MDFSQVTRRVLVCLGFALTVTRPVSAAQIQEFDAARPSTAVILTSAAGCITSSSGAFKDGPASAFDTTGKRRMLKQVKSFNLMYTFDAPTVIDGYGIMAGGTYYDPKRAPKSWTIYGSNNYVPGASGSVDNVAADAAATWVELDTRSDQPTWAANKYRYYTFRNLTGYMTYKIAITANQSDEYTQWKYMEFCRQTPDRVLEVKGIPDEIAAVSPAFGVSALPAEATDFASPLLMTNADETVVNRCTGYCVYQRDASLTAWSLVAEGEANAFRLDPMPTETTRVEWYYESLYRVTVEESENGSVRGAGWYAKGTIATLTPIAAEGYQFREWTGDVPAGRARDKSLRLTMTGPLCIKPVFELFEPNVTRRMTKLTSPHVEQFSGTGLKVYARNVWTMKAFDGKVFIGAGDWGANAGPIPVYAYNPESGAFDCEVTVNDEQVDVFRELGGKLYLPHCDDRGSWTWSGYCYRLPGSTAWKSMKTMTNAVHVFDMAQRNGMLYGAGHGVWWSNNEGASFSYLETSRRYAILAFPTRTYAIGDADHGHKYEYDSEKKTWIARNTGYREFAGSQFTKAAKSTDLILKFRDTAVMPGLTMTPENTNTVYSVRRSISFKDRVLYLGVHYGNGEQYNPFAAYSAVDGNDGFQATQITLPEGVQPWFFTTVNETVYLLFSERLTLPRNTSERFVNHVWSSTDGVNFSPLFQFRAPTFARSMDYLDGTFYFGLGIAKSEALSEDTPEEVLEATGQFWFVNEKDVFRKPLTISIR